MDEATINTLKQYYTDFRVALSLYNNLKAATLRDMKVTFNTQNGRDNLSGYIYAQNLKLLSIRHDDGYGRSHGAASVVVPPVDILRITRAAMWRRMADLSEAIKKLGSSPPDMPPAPEELPSNAKFVAYTGGVSEGITLIGPFDDDQAAANWLDANNMSCGQVLEIVSPEEWVKKNGG